MPRSCNRASTGSGTGDQQSSGEDFEMVVFVPQVRFREVVHGAECGSLFGELHLETQ